MKREQNGLALGTVLACLAALAIVLFAAVSASLSHLSFSQASTNQEHAQNLADAALSEAIGRLVTSNYSFGQNSSDEIQVTIPGLQDAEGWLRFDSSGPFAGKQSVNNLDSDNQVVGGLGRTVPGRTVHLIARGRVGNTVRWVECLYHKPPFPDGLIATGPIDAKTLHLVGIRQEGDYTGGDPNSIPPENTLPGNLFSNSTSGFVAAGPSATVSQNSLITGSAGSVASVTNDATSVVQGELLPFSDPRPMPNLDIRGKINLLLPNAIPIANSYPGSHQLDPDWFCLADGGLSVGGDLELQGSALLVRGDLNVARAITGTGVVLVDGNVTIGDGGTNVVTGDQVAIACTRDFVLSAAAPESNYFKGLVYCEGDFEARDITVVGATVVHGKNGSRGSAELENVRFIYNPGAVELVLQPPRGYEDQNHTLAIGFTLRPGPVEGEYLCDARAYFGRSDDCGDKTGNPPNIDNPEVWPTLDSSTPTPPTPLNPADPDNWYQAFLDVPVGNPNDPNFGLNLQTQIGDWAENFQTDVAGEGRGDWRTAVANVPAGIGFQQYLRDAIVQTDTTQRVSFNLNNLFAETMGSSRILYWRPVTQ